MLFAAAFAWAALDRHDVGLLPLAVVIEMSDMADGFVARRTATGSNVGTVYDGMADLIARMTEFVCLAAIGAIGFVPVLVLLWREALVITAQRVAIETGGRVRYGRISGKLKEIARPRTTGSESSLQQATGFRHSGESAPSTSHCGLAGDRRHGPLRR